MEYGEAPGERGTEIQIEEVPRLNQAIESFDMARHEFLAACNEFSNEPSGQAQNDLGTYGSAMTKTFSNTVQAIWEVEPDELLRVRMVANLITEEDADRVTLFREKAKCEGFDYLSGSKSTDTTAAEDMIKEAALEFGMADLPDALAKLFAASLQDDVNHFAQHAVANYVPQQTPEDMRRVIAKVIGTHAIDIGKVALGTALGIWAMRNRGKS